MCVHMYWVLGCEHGVCGIIMSMQRAYACMVWCIQGTCVCVHMYMYMPAGL